MTTGNHCSCTAHSSTQAKINLHTYILVSTTFSSHTKHIAEYLQALHQHDRHIPSPLHGASPTIPIVGISVRNHLPTALQHNFALTYRELLRHFPQNLNPPRPNRRPSINTLLHLNMPPPALAPPTHSLNRAIYHLARVRILKPPTKCCSVRAVLLHPLGAGVLQTVHRLPRVWEQLAHSSQVFSESEHRPVVSGIKGCFGVYEGNAV